MQQPPDSRITTGQRNSVYLASGEMARNAMRKALETASVGSTSRPPRFSPAFQGRKRSIILDGEEASQNALVNPKLLKYHKKAPTKPQNRQDVQKAMTDQEFSWWSNPFLRMLSSPLRACVLTKRYAPTDHLIRMTAALLPQPGTPISSSTPLYLVPSDLHHPRYAQRPEGIGAYIACSKKAVQLLSGRGRHKSIFPGAEIHGLLEEQIESGLQARCLEEAQLLGTHLRTTTRYKPGEPAAFTIRRLTVTEYEMAINESIIHDSNAMAIIVVPKDGQVTGASAETSLQSQFLLRGPLPVAVVGAGPSVMLPAPRIPVFRATSMFKHPDNRTYLRKALDLALSAERNALRNARRFQPAETHEALVTTYEPKAREAYALCASRRADAVPLVIAFWRLRLWEANNDI